MAAQNAVFGSTMSPARLLQIREIILEYLSLVDHNCPIFQLYLPDIIKQRYPGRSLHEDGISQDFGAQSRKPILTFVYMDIPFG